MAEANFANRTIWTGDNLDILRGMNSECVDLVYLDPPFNSKSDLFGACRIGRVPEPPSRTPGRFRTSMLRGSGSLRTNIRRSIR